MGVEEALAELRRFSGTQFDAETVAAVEAVVRSGQADGGAEAPDLVA